MWWTGWAALLIRPQRRTAPGALLEFSKPSLGIKGWGSTGIFSSRIFKKSLHGQTWQHTWEKSQQKDGHTNAISWASPGAQPSIQSEAVNTPRYNPALFCSSASLKHTFLSLSVSRYNDFSCWGNVTWPDRIGAVGEGRQANYSSLCDIIIFNNTNNNITQHTNKTL